MIARGKIILAEKLNTSGVSQSQCVGLFYANGYV